MFILYQIKNAVHLTVSLSKSMHTIKIDLINSVNEAYSWNKLQRWNIQTMYRFTEIAIYFKDPVDDF